MLAAQRRMQHISEAEYRASRDRVFEDARTTEGPALAWLDAYVEGVQNADDAREALALEPQPVVFPALEGALFYGRTLGRTYLLAGRVDDAIAVARQASASCTRIDGFLKQVQATETLGEALEQKGDRDGACAAYATVLARWGHAKPRSVTADAARSHAKKLGCGPG